MADTITTASATAKFVRVSPMKARRVLALVRGKDVAEALAILKYAPQGAAKDVAKVVASAAANAENNFGLDPRTLVISECYACLLYTSPSPRDATLSRMPSSA